MLVLRSQVPIQIRETVIPYVKPMFLLRYVVQQAHHVSTVGT